MADQGHDFNVCSRRAAVLPTSRGGDILSATMDKFTDCTIFTPCRNGTKFLHSFLVRAARPHPACFFYFFISK
jgi:hypothetical protein